MTSDAQLTQSDLDRLRELGGRDNASHLILADNARIAANLQDPKRIRRVDHQTSRNSENGNP